MLGEGMVVCLQRSEERRWLVVFSVKTNNTSAPEIIEDQPPPPHLTSLKTNNHLLSSYH
jgi:hypothetical protein